MVKAALVATEYTTGLEVVRALERSGLQISVALWLYSDEHEDWRFVLASRRLDAARAPEGALPQRPERSHGAGQGLPPRRLRRRRAQRALGAPVPRAEDPPGGGGQGAPAEGAAPRRLAPASVSRLEVRAGALMRSAGGAPGPVDSAWRPLQPLGHRPEVRMPRRAHAARPALSGSPQIRRPA